jgi:hypothetical protein
VALEQAHQEGFALDAGDVHLLQRKASAKMRQKVR